METIRIHKVRSFLTVLGVVIGVTVAILVTSILLAVENSVQASLNDFGMNNIWVFRFEIGIRLDRMTTEERMRKTLTYEDAMAIQENLPAVKAVSLAVLQRQDRGTPRIRVARYKNHELSNLNFFGTIANYPEVENGQIQDGRFFTEMEDQHRADVAVIGYDVAHSLFPDESPIDKPLLVDGNIYKVIGVFERKRNNFVGGGDNELAIPYRSYRKHYSQDDEHLLAVVAFPGKKAFAEDQIRSLLRQRRRVAPGQPDNFGISSAEQLGNRFRDIMATIFLLVVPVISIGLLVGGVGVMNIMLMGVTERTREIGMRKAIGARNRDIGLQFLTETMTLTGAGGVIGVVLALGISFILRLLNFPSAVPFWTILLAVAVAGAVGMFFGIYPAMKAAQLDPVTALRHE